MNKKIKLLIDKIEEIENKFGGSIFNSCNESDISAFQVWIDEINLKCSHELSGFIDISRIADGLTFNGLIIYSITPDDDENSIYSMNETWWENEHLSKYLFFADDSISWFCLEISTGIFRVLDKASGEKMEEYSSFNELICRAFETMLL